MGDLALSQRARAATALGAAVASLSRRLRAGDGTVIGGRVTLAVEPRSLRLLSRRLDCALVSGTNGKTTTTRLLGAALSARGRVVSNGGGSNMPSGLVAALARGGPSELAALEVDEGYLPVVAEAVDPAVVVLLNLSRDQLDRNSEVRMVARRWRSALEGLRGAVVANADDPIVAWSALGAARVTWVAAGHAWRSDASGCPRCESRISYAEQGVGWECGGCGLARPEPDAWLEGDALVRSADRPVPFELSLPGWFNRANAAMASTAAAILGVPESEALAAMEATREVSGRYQVVRVGGVCARLLLSKNPAGWAGVLGVLSPPPSPVVIAINARVADGRDPSWLWDVPFERLGGRVVVATGERRADLAVRLSYAGIEHTSVAGQTEALRAAAELAGSGETVDYVGNYTAFQDLRRSLGGPAASDGGE